MRINTYFMINDILLDFVTFYLSVFIEGNHRKGVGSGEQGIIINQPDLIRT